MDDREKLALANKLFNEVYDPWTDSSLTIKKVLQDMQEKPLEILDYVVNLYIELLNN